jgi:hypothetical protein
MAGILGLWMGWNDAAKDLAEGFRDGMNDA